MRAWSNEACPSKEPPCPTARSTRTGSKTDRAARRTRRTAALRNALRTNFAESRLPEVGGYHPVAFRPSTCGPFLRGVSPLTYTLPLDQIRIDIPISPLARFALPAQSLGCVRQGSHSWRTKVARAIPPLLARGRA